MSLCDMTKKINNKNNTIMYVCMYVCVIFVVYMYVTIEREKDNVCVHFMSACDYSIRYIHV